MSTVTEAGQLGSTQAPWLLDTCTLSDAIRNPQGRVAERLKALSASHPEQLVTSVIVQCELLFGANKVASNSLADKIDTLLQFIPPLPLDANVAAHYATLRAKLERAGTPIGPNDMLIAAHALAHNATLITDNEAKFRRVTGLRVENWLR